MRTKLCVPELQKRQDWPQVNAFASLVESVVFSRRRKVYSVIKAVLAARVHTVRLMYILKCEGLGAWGAPTSVWR